MLDSCHVGHKLCCSVPFAGNDVVAVVQSTDGGSGGGQHSSPRLSATLPGIEAAERCSCTELLSFTLAVRQTGRLAVRVVSMPSPAWGSRDRSRPTASGLPARSRPSRNRRSSPDGSWSDRTPSAGVAKKLSRIVGDSPLGDTPMASPWQLDTALKPLRTTPGCSWLCVEVDRFSVERLAAESVGRFGVVRCYGRWKWRALESSAGAHSDGRALVK